MKGTFNVSKYDSEHRWSKLPCLDDLANRICDAHTGVGTAFSSAVDPQTLSIAKGLVPHGQRGKSLKRCGVGERHGLNPVLAAMPPEWWPIIESIVAHRRPPLVTAASKATSDDHEIPTFLRRELIAAPLKAEVASPLKHDPNIDDPGADYSTAAGRGMAEGPPFLGELRR